MKINIETLLSEFYQDLAKENEERVTSYRMATFYNFVLWLLEMKYLRLPKNHPARKKL